MEPPDKLIVRIDSFLRKHQRDNVLFVLDTSAWLRLYWAVPNRVPRFLFNYVNCGYPVRLTEHIKEEFYSNIVYLPKKVMEKAKDSASHLQRGERTEMLAMDDVPEEKRSEIYQKLLAIYSGGKTGDLIERAFGDASHKEVIGLSENEKAAVIEEAKRRIEAKIPFPGRRDRFKSGNRFGDFLIFEELKKLARQEKASLVFVTFDLKEKRKWPSFQREFFAETGYELCYVDIPSFDRFTDRYGSAGDVLGMPIRNAIISEHLQEVQELCASEIGKAVDEYFASGRCYLANPSDNKLFSSARLLKHQESNFIVDFGCDNNGSASYDCEFDVEADVEVIYLTFSLAGHEQPVQIAEKKHLKGSTFGMITRNYGRAEDILDFDKESWLDISVINFA